jgi:hypothetical protein
MTTNISDYLDVGERIRLLGGQMPVNLALLPANFETAASLTDFRQVSEAATVKTLFRQSGIQLDDIGRAGQRIPYVQNNAFEWVAPTLFVSAALLSDNQSSISIALGVIANYATDFFKGMSGKNQVTLDVIVERTKSKTYKRISYKGDPEGLKSLPKIISEMADD